MFVRAKTAKGKTYYQVVENVRIGSTVKQRVVVSLGTTSDPKAALKALKAEMAQEEPVRRPGYRAPLPPSRRVASRWRREDAVRDRVRVLTRVVKQGLIGSPPRRCAVSTRRRAYHEAGHAVVRWRQARKICYLTLEPTSHSAAHVAIPREPKFVGGDPHMQDLRRLRRELAFCCAGSAAEAVLRGDFRDDYMILDGHGPGGDRYKALSYMETMGIKEQARMPFLFRAYFKTREWLRKPAVWCQVEAMAEELIRRRRLTGAEAKAICKAAKRA
jgi:hypothetical protein